jgi:hypothetical protein
MAVYSQESSQDPSVLFLESAQALGASCGILVWELEDESGFAEKARFGYGEDGFFYSFLARGLGNLEAVQNSPEPVVFPKEEFPLYLEESKFAVVSGIWEGNRFKGFLLLEFSDLIESAKISCFLLSKFLTKTSSISHHKSKEFSAIQYILDIFPDLKSQFSEWKNLSPSLVLGARGTGKKMLTKYLYKTLGRSGEWILIGSIPENLGKLEKSLQNWEELAAPEGFLVFDSVFNLGLGQQRIFYEWLEEGSFGGKILFVDRLGKPKEPYPPFWNMIQSNQIILPGLEKFTQEEMSGLIDVLFIEICEQLEKSNLHLDPQVKEELAARTYSGNLEELRSVLGNGIWRARGITVGQEEIGSPSNESQVSLEMPGAEDLDLPKCIEALERQKILLADKLFSGNQLRMAKALKISRGSLQYKMKNLGL